MVVETFRFGQFELDPSAGELRRDGRRRRLQAQPFKLLVLLTRRAGTLVTYDEIRAELWGEDTFVEFDQAVHYAIRQIREALGDSAEQPLYVETVPRRGYRFIAPVDRPRQNPDPTPVTPASRTHADLPPGGGGGQVTEVSGGRTSTTVRLQKALWTNIAELRETQARQKATQKILIGLLIVASLAVVGLLVYVLV